MLKFILLIIILVVIISSMVLVNDNRIEIKLVECVDGDTAWFNINDSNEKVRFLGVDTPESTIIQEEYGKEANDYTCELLKNANNIYIEYDINSDKYDKYNRVLGWIFVDDKNISELLLAKGYAEVKYVYGNYKYLDNLCSIQIKAYEERLGIWDTNYSKYKDNYCYKNGY